MKELKEYGAIFPTIGTGYVTTSPITGLCKEPITLAGETLIVGKKTTLQGHFPNPIKYVGCIKTQHKSIELIFF